MMSVGGRDLLARTCKVLLVDWQAQPMHPLLACVLAEVTTIVAVARSALTMRLLPSTHSAQVAGAVMGWSCTMICSP